MKNSFIQYVDIFYNRDNIIRTFIFLWIKLYIVANTLCHVKCIYSLTVCQLKDKCFDL